MGFQAWQTRTTFYDIPTTTWFHHLRDPNASGYFDPHVYWSASVAQPYRQNKTCAAVVVYTTMRLEWITVPCDREFDRVLVICERKDMPNQNQGENPTQHNHTIIISRQVMECSHGWIQVDSTCYRMVPLPMPNSTHCDMGQYLHVCYDIQGRQGVYIPNSGSGLQLLRYLKHWLINPTEDGLYIAQWTEDNVTRCVAKTFLETESPIMTLTDAGSVQVKYVLCERDLDLSDMSCLDTQFRCADNTCILAHHHCDGILDCPDSSDEDACDTACSFTPDTTTAKEVHNYEASPKPGMSCFKGCFPEMCRCSVLYFHCEDTGRCLPASKLCDGISDCLYREDESLCSIKETDSKHKIGEVEGYPLMDSFAYTTGETNNTGNRIICNTSLTSCRKRGKREHHYCFPMYKVCLFERDSIDQALRYCPNGEHLQSCINHQCKSDFKCPQSYCIPTHYVCNGRADCPYGEDEQNCSKSCPGLLRCRDDNVCVHPNYVGNGIVDCLVSRDDEILKEIGKCPQGHNCHCLGAAASCPWSTLQDLPKAAVGFKVFSLIGNRIQNLSNPVSSPSILILDLSNNSVKSIVHLRLEKLPSLIKLQLDNNYVMVLKAKVFIGVRYLQILGLKENSIRSISIGAFHGMLRLRVLDLSGNPLHILNPLAFSELSHTIWHIHYRNNIVNHRFILMINQWSQLRSVSLDLASYCPYIHDHIRCNNAIRNYVSCCSLLNSKILTVLTWGYVAIGSILNVICLLYIMLSSQHSSTKVQYALMYSSHLVIIFYLISMCALNSFYDEMFLLYREQLLHGMFCVILASAAYIGDRASQIAFLFICFQRFYVVAWPLKDPRSLPKWYGIILALVLLLLVLPLLAYPFIRDSDTLLEIPCVLVPIAGQSMPNALYFLIFYLLFNCAICFTGVALLILASYRLQTSESPKLRHSGGSSIKLSAFKRNCLIIVMNIVYVLVTCIVQYFLLNTTVDSTVMVFALLAICSHCLINPVIYNISTHNFMEWSLGIVLKTVH